MILETKSGLLITGDMSVLTFDGVSHEYKVASDVGIGDVVCVNRKYKFSEKEPDVEYSYSKGSRFATVVKDVNIPSKYSPDLGEWLGYVIANGSSSANTITMSSNVSAKTVNYEKLAKRIFDVVVGVSNDKLDCKTFRINSVKVKEFLDVLCNGFSTARFKTVPEGLLLSTKETQRKFLRALFDCDGSQLKHDFEYSSASEDLIRGVQLLLLRFGIASHIRRNYVKASPDHTYWKLFVAGYNLDILYEDILYDSFKYTPIIHKKRNTNVNVIYGALELIIREVNLARETLGVNASGAYRKTSGELARFKAAKHLVTMNCFNISYDMMSKVYGDFLSSPEDQQEVLKGVIVFVKDILDNNYFYDIIADKGDNISECAYYNEMFLLGET